MEYWDQLLLAHFCVDKSYIEKVTSDVEFKKSNTIRFFHAPNHRNVKGTKYFEAAVSRLKDEGHDVELIIVERSNNLEVLRVMKSCDVVLDQLIIGWYAMFALEGLALNKLVVTHLRQDLIDLYKFNDLLRDDEIPFVNTNHNDVYTSLKDIVVNYNHYETLKNRNLVFLQKHHSLEKMADVFSNAQNKIWSEDES